MKAKILYVEDDDSLSFITKDQLEMESYDAVSYTHLDVYKRQAEGKEKCQSPMGALRL